MSTSFVQFVINNSFIHFSLSDRMWTKIRKDDNKALVEKLTFKPYKVSSTRSAHLFNTIVIFDYVLIKYNSRTVDDTRGWE